MVEKNWGHYSYLMAIKTNLSHLEPGLQLKMVIEIGSIATKFHWATKKTKFILVTI
jgi:hypothetical protein